MDNFLTTFEISNLKFILLLICLSIHVHDIYLLCTIDLSVPINIIILYLVFTIFVFYLRLIWHTYQVEFVIYYLFEKYVLLRIRRFCRIDQQSDNDILSIPMRLLKIV